MLFSHMAQSGMKWKRSAALALALALAAGVCSAPASAASAASGTIILGQSAPLTGPAKDLGIDMRDGALAYFDFVNKSGGVNGKQIELRTLDDGYEPEKAEANTKLFIEAGVFSLFGYVGTPTSNKAKPLFDKAGIPFVGAFTGAESLRSPVDRMVFNYRSGYVDEAERIVEHVTEFGLKKIAVFYQNDAYGQAGLSAVKKAMDKRHLEITATGTVERNKTTEADVKAAVEALSKADPEAIVMISASGSVAAFVKSYKKVTPKLPQFVTVSFVGSVALSRTLGKEGYGVVISQVVPEFQDVSVPVVGEYQRLMRARNPTARLSFTSLEGFMAAKVMVEGIKRAGGSLTTDSFVRGMETMKRFDLGGVYVSYSADDHRGSSFVDLTMIDKSGDFLY